LQYKVWIFYGVIAGLQTMLTYIFPYLTKLPALECLKGGSWSTC